MSTTDKETIAINNWTESHIKKKNCPFKKKEKYQTCAFYFKPHFINPLFLTSRRDRDAQLGFCKSQNNQPKKKRHFLITQTLDKVANSQC